MISEPVVTRSLRAARVAVAVAVCAAPVASALLLVPEGLPMWPMLLALALGLAARAAVPRSRVFLLVTLAVGPLWQVGATLVTGAIDLQHLMPWLAALGGWLAWPTAAAWSVTGAWQLGVVTWALVLAVTWPITAVRELDFTLQTIGVPVANGSFGMSPHLSAATVVLIAQAQLVALLLFDWAWGASAATRRRAWLALAPAVAASCLLAVWQQMIDLSFLSSEPWLTFRRAAGPFYDANAMGALAALGGTALAASEMRPAAVPGVLWTSSWAAMALAGVVASGSRTALAALATSLIVAAFFGLRPRDRVLAGLVMVAAVVAVSQVAPGSGDAAKGNAVSRLADSVGRAVSGGSTTLLEFAWRRDGYGPASMAVIADHPWVGVGPGAFANVVADYAREALALNLPPDNAQNWWRQQFAELGLLGAAAPVLCSVLVMLAVLRAWRGPRADRARSAPLITLGLMAVVSPATQHPVLLVIAALLVAQGVAPRDDLPVIAATAAATGPSPRVSAWVAWSVALACAAGLAVAGWSTFRPPHRAARFHFVYNYGVSDAVQTPFGAGRWSAAHSVAVFAPDNRLLVINAVLPHADLAAAPVTVTIGDGHRVLCREERRDHTPVECRMEIPDGRWPLVEVDVSRPWFGDGGAAQSALLSGRFVREP